MDQPFSRNLVLMQWLGYNQLMYSQQIKHKLEILPLR